MSQEYIVYQSYETCDYCNIVGIFLDEKKCDDFIDEKNKDLSDNYGKVAVALME